MQEGAPNQQHNDPIPDPTPDTPADSFTEEVPEPVTTGGGLNLKLIIGSIVGVLVLAGAAIAAYAVLGLGGNTGPEPTPEPTAVASSSPSPGTRLDPDQQIAVLESEGATVGESSGEAARSVDAGQFVLAVSADLPDPAAGSFYEVFLVQPDSETQFSAGRMYKVGGRWVMTLDQTRDASAYSQVRVTAETKDDGKPETTVLSGQF